MKTHTQKLLGWPLPRKHWARPAFAGGIAILSVVLLSHRCFAADDAQGAQGRANLTPDQLAKLSLEELMQTRVTTQNTVSRVDEKIDAAPGSVYVFTRETIQKRGYTSLGDLLQTVPGFTVFHRDLGYVAGVRGLNANDNDKITLLINGQNLNGVHEQGLSLNGPINLDSVERVEVVVGPSSFFQQANTLAATINVITRNVDGVEVSSSVGNRLQYSETLMAGHHWAPDKFLSFSFTTEAIKGFDAWNRYFQPNLAGRKITGELFGSSYFGILNGQNGEVTAQAIAYRADWPEFHIDSGSLQNDGVMSEQLYSIFIKDEHPWSSTLTSVVRVDATLKEQTRQNDGGTIPVNSVQQVLHQMVYTGEVGFRYTDFTHQLIQGGVQATYDHNFDNWYTFDSNGQTTSKTTLFDEDVSAFGFYVDDTIQVTKRLKLIEGVRMDYSSKLPGNQWFPGGRSAIILEPTPKWTTKLIYNRSVRMPSDLEALNQVWGSSHLDTAPSFANVSSQATSPEILTTFELQNIFYIGKARFAATVYHEELENFISWFAPHSNGGNFRGDGVELNLNAPLSPKIAVWANASWNNAKLDLFNSKLFGAQPQSATGGTESIHAYVNDKGRLIGSAAYTANLGFDITLMDHLTLTPAIRYFTDQAAVENNSNNPVYKTLRNRYYLDAALTWDHVGGRDMDLRLSARNLLNNREPVASQQQADTYRPSGIEVLFTVALRF
ncbi:MAG: TonB-dependent receptor [Chthoniobacteraceae bacterium]